MKLSHLIAPVTLAAALALTGCTSTPAPVAAPSPAYTPATISTPAAPAPVKAAPKPAAVKAAPKVAKVATAPMDTITAPAPVRCEEDMPCWDCHTMGNLQCGPIADPAAYVAAAHRRQAPAAYVPCSAVGMVADSHGVCHKPAPVFKGRTSAPGQTFPVPPHAEPAPKFCEDLTLGEGELARSCEWKRLDASIVLHLATNTCDIDATRIGVKVPATCDPSKIEYLTPTQIAPGVDVRCLYGKLHCVATLQG